MSVEKVYSYAIQLLAKQDYSKKQLKENLQTKKFSTQNIDEVLAILEQKNIQNDNAFCQNLINKYVENGKGPKFILNKIKQKKYDVEVDFSFYDWFVLAQSAYKKKYQDSNKITDIKEKNKRMNFFACAWFLLSRCIRCNKRKLK